MTILKEAVLSGCVFVIDVVPYLNYFTGVLINCSSPYDFKCTSIKAKNNFISAEDIVFSNCV